ncbi:hypothetical protein [Photobacterium sanguinicancri]|uniref:hypothetical protein n=1 Tax=Photobacterium sanguinicancri TaxID=875932 RepID=UPI003D152606
MTGLKRTLSRKRITIFRALARMISAVLVVVGMLGASVALACEPIWHNQVSVEQGALSLNDGQHAFTVNAEGKLYFGVHRVALSAEQQQVLSDYHQLMLADLAQLLPISDEVEISDELCQKVAARQQKEQQIQSTIPALKAWRTVTL